MDWGSFGIRHTLLPLLILLFCCNLKFANQTKHALEISANDNTWSEEAMHDCFYFSNMSPQKQNFNNEVWKQLELYVHNLALQYDTLYIATGPVLKAKKPFKTIGANEVSVPEYFYKVIMVYGTQPQAIGYLIPQVGYSKDFNDYACSVDKVEKVTGVDFYWNLNNAIEKIIEQKTNDVFIKQ